MVVSLPLDTGGILDGPCPVHPDVADLVGRLSLAEIGATTNQYSPGAPDGAGCRARLSQYLSSRWSKAELVLVGEAAGYKGALLSGIAFTSVRQLGIGTTSEQSATIVHRVLSAHGAEHRVILWNTVPTHPFAVGARGCSNRTPTKEEVEAGRVFLAGVVAGRRVVAVGRVAASVLGEVECVRHPARGGATAFATQLGAILSKRDGHA